MSLIVDRSACFQTTLGGLQQGVPRGKRGIHFNTEKIPSDGCKVEYISELCIYVEIVSVPDCIVAQQVVLKLHK